MCERERERESGCVSVFVCLSVCLSVSVCLYYLCVHGDGCVFDQRIK